MRKAPGFQKYVPALKRITAELEEIGEKKLKLATEHHALSFFEKVYVEDVQFAEELGNKYTGPHDFEEHGVPGSLYEDGNF